MTHPPLDLLHPVPFEGTVATQLIIGDLNAPHVERAIKKAARMWRVRASMIAGVAAATETPKALIRRLSSVDLARASDWVAAAFDRESRTLWPR